MSLVACAHSAPKDELFEWSLLATKRRKPTLERLVILNPTAGGGRAGERWERILKEVPAPHRVHEWGEGEDLRPVIRAAFLAGARTFFAAGGDGTVNGLGQALMEELSYEELTRVIFGAIGLGSSNDFHKPFCGRVPLSVDEKGAQWRDVLSLQLVTESGKQLHRYALLNISCGLTAEANGCFNRPDFLLKRLKKCSTPLAIWYATVKTLLRYGGSSLWVSTPHWKREYVVTNLGVVKSPFFAGDFAYAPHFSQNDGRFSLYLCHGMSFWQLLKVLNLLSHKSFSTGENALALHFEAGEKVEIQASEPFSIEMDGEVEWVLQATVELEKEKLRCCGQI